MSTCESIIVVLCWGEDVCVELGHVEHQIELIVSQDIICVPFTCRQGCAVVVVL